ncbi:hypothetical protein Fot_25425 [Forsythia ovata]|uniref:Uncharacterized protein n=1 Tax=Forsythia ovata TaxID=205694 RepID=A0ABD1U909_9LAMI
MEPFKTSKIPSDPKSVKCFIPALRYTIDSQKLEESVFESKHTDLNLVQPKHMLMWRQKMAAEISGGVFESKHTDLNLVQPKHMLMWRQKMAAEIFGGEFDP